MKVRFLLACSNARARARAGFGFQKPGIARNVFALASHSPSLPASAPDSTWPAQSGATAAAFLKFDKATSYFRLLQRACRRRVESPHGRAFFARRSCFQAIQPLNPQPHAVGIGCRRSHFQIASAAGRIGGMVIVFRALCQIEGNRRSSPTDPLPCSSTGRRSRCGGLSRTNCLQVARSASSGRLPPTLLKPMLSIIFD